MAAILKEEPPVLADSGKQIPPELERVIERCLAKNPAQRFHSAHDLAFALRTLPSSAGEHKSVLLAARARRGVAAAIAALLLILAATGIYYWRARPGQAD